MVVILSHPVAQLMQPDPTQPDLTQLLDCATQLFRLFLINVL